MNFEIHSACPEDAEAWAKLRYALWPDCPPARHALEIQQLLASDGVVALARLDSEIVGMAELSIRRDHVEGTAATPVPYLEGWFVAVSARNRGIGRALLKFIEDWCREKGYQELASDAELHNTHSIQVHRHLGFREVGRSVHFVKSLH